MVRKRKKKQSRSKRYVPGTFEEQELEEILDGGENGAIPDDDIECCDDGTEPILIECEEE